MTALSVNLNKIAVLRNSRGGRLPDPLEAARVCIDAGCQGITVHPRPDGRHIRSHDVYALAQLLADQAPGIEFNIEGNPFAAARGDYPGLLALAERVRPDQCTLVPDGDDQLTSDHGFVLARDRERLVPVVAALKSLGIRVSLFMDAGSPDIAGVAAIGAGRIEIYTGPYAEAFAEGRADDALDLCRATADDARAAGLGVNAGHDLDQANLGPLLSAVPDIAEVSIGHALIGEALYDGLGPTVRNYLRVIAAAGTRGPSGRPRVTTARDRSRSG